MKYRSQVTLKRGGLSVNDMDYSKIKRKAEMKNAIRRDGLIIGKRKWHIKKIEKRHEKSETRHGCNVCGPYWPVVYTCITCSQESNDKQHGLSMLQGASPITRESVNISHVKLIILFCLGGQVRLQ